MPESEIISDTVLLNTFVINKKRCRTYLHRGILIWEMERPPYTRWTLPLTDVISISHGDEWLPMAMNNIKEKETSTISISPNTSLTSFVLHYAVCGTKNKWEHHSITMSHTDPKQISSWVKTIQNYLSELTYRPRKILVFVNPFGGKKKGLKIWEKQVLPLMTIARIETKLIITERAGHIKDTLLSADLNDFDAIVCVGGDGTLSEIFNGLVLRVAKDQQIDPNDPKVVLPKPRVPVGVIPGGSTNTVAYSLHGTTDVETAAIHILFGDTHGLDLSSVHNNDSMLRLYASVVSYGYLGDVIQDSEKFRWMGPQRYDYSGFKKIIANKGYEGEIELLSDPCHPSASTKCMQHCTRCIQHRHKTIPNEEITRWLTISGKFFMVNGANLSCACTRSPMGFSPHCHIGDGCVDIIIIKHTSFFNNIRMLLRLSSKDKTLYDLPFVEVYRAREFTFKASPKSNYSENGTSLTLNSGLSVWNCDGEVIQVPNIRIRVHCQLLNVYTRRIPEPMEKPSCFFSI